MSLIPLRQYCVLLHRFEMPVPNGSVNHFLDVNHQVRREYFGLV